jgi:serine/threonine protein kinase
MATKELSASAGTRFGPYEVRSHVGTGGMAEVYRAVHIETGQEVALKVLGRSWRAIPHALSRFSREVDAIRSSRHPNVVTIFEVGLDSRPPYVAMEYVPGKTLRAVLERGPLSIPSALELGVQLAAGLAAAHEAGIVHRDLKPENVIVTPEGSVKILDFGLSKSLRKRPSPGELDESLTLPGMILGTLQYMSPEQAKGRRVDFRADQFSLAAILYEMVTGAAAFAGETIPRTLATVIGAEPSGIETFRAFAPPDVLSLVERALSKSPEDRFPTMAEMRKALVAARRRHRRGFFTRILRRARRAVAGTAPSRAQRRFPGSHTPSNATGLSNCAGSSAS